MRKIYWSDLTTEDFVGLPVDRTIAILPVAAIEQHGPHLPVSTDTSIAEGMIAETIAALPLDLNVLWLPIQSVGKSNEHIRSPGTLTFSADVALRVWIEIGESVARAGLRKIVFINSHGGNSDLLAVAARELRVRCQMLAVHTQWRKLGLPEKMFDALEATHGIHAGDIETSLMLYFRPDLVKMDKARNFVSNAAEIEKTCRVLRATGPAAAFGWIAQDLHADGGLGDASKATMEKGKAVAAFQAARFIELLRDVADFDLSRLA